MAEVTMDEMETAGKADEAAKTPVSLKDMKLDASDVPDYLKGKSVDDLVETNRRLQESLKISEDARTSLSAAARSIPDPREAVVADPVDKMTPEEWEEMFKTEPLKAMTLYETRLMKTLGTHLDERFKPLVSGGISAQEDAAKAKYPEVFELFGDQIDKVKAQVDPKVLSTAQGWKDIVAYVRGLEGNFEKIVQHKTKSPAKAREAERESVGYTPTATARSSAPVSVGDSGLDATQLKIAETMGLTAAEYKKWSIET